MRNAILNITFLFISCIGLTCALEIPEKPSDVLPFTIWMDNDLAITYPIEIFPDGSVSFSAKENRGKKKINITKDEIISIYTQLRQAMQNTNFNEINEDALGRRIRFELKFDGTHVHFSLSEKVFGENLYDQLLASIRPLLQKMIALNTAKESQ